MLHLCRVDLVVKVDKAAPLLLIGSWIMCCWLVGSRDAAAGVSIICIHHVMNEIDLVKMTLSSSYSTEIMRAICCSFSVARPGRNTRLMADPGNIVVVEANGRHRNITILCTKINLLVDKQAISVSLQLQNQSKSNLFLN